MNLFSENGHLSEQGLQALVYGTLNEDQRLQAAEHLSVCERCIMRYTDLLTDSVCLQPEQDMVLPVSRAIRARRVWRVLTGRYATAAAAVMLTFTMWSVGAFPILKAQPPTKQHWRYAESSFHLRQVLWNVSDSFNSMMHQFSKEISLSEQMDKIDRQKELPDKQLETD